MKAFFERMGARAMAFLQYMGGSVILFTQTILWVPFMFNRFKQIVDHMMKVGVYSFPICTLTSFFIGVVIAFQSAYQMQKVNAVMYIPSLVAISITREIGPIITALVVAGRVGAAMAAEIGSMKATEQIDALEALATNSVRYLVTPRFLALFFMLPVLTIFADLLGILGGYVVCIYKLGLSHAVYMRMAFLPLAMKDIVTGLAKTLIFAVIIVIIACYEGMKVEGGAEGVGNATTRAVVISFVLIIMSDALFTYIFYFIG